MLISYNRYIIPPELVYQASAARLHGKQGVSGGETGDTRLATLTEKPPEDSALLSWQRIGDVSVSPVSDVVDANAVRRETGMPVRFALLDLSDKIRSRTPRRKLTRVPKKR
jgi:hypothetical protein